MCSTSFLQVTDESGMTLADLQPVGYLDVTEWADNSKRGFKGELTVKVLNNGGGIETDGANKDKCYQFYAPWSKSGGWGATYWTQVDATGTEKIEDASKVKFPVGTGLWIEMSADSYFGGKYPDNQYKIQHSGAAMLEARQIDLRPGKKGVSITVSADITLANIHPMGYLDVTEWADNSKRGFKGELTVKVLNNGGGIETDGANKDKCYQFYAPWSKSGGWGATYWTQVDATGTEKIEDASTVKFPIGTGLWIEMSADSYFDGKYPDDQYKVEFDGIENL